MAIHAFPPNDADPIEMYRSPDSSPHTPPYTTGKADQSNREHRWALMRCVVLVVAIACSDILLIKSTWNMILLEDEYVSWMLGILTALGAAAAMWGAGKLAVTASVDRSRPDALAAMALTGAWALVGAGITYLRWHAAELTNVTVTAEGQGADTSAVSTHQVMALVLLTLYVLPGVLAFVDAWLLSNPIAARQRTSHELLANLEKHLPHLRARVNELTELRDRHQAELDRIDTNSTNAQQAAAALADELRAHARTEMHRWLGDPANGGMTRMDPSPRPENE